MPKKSKSIYRKNFPEFSDLKAIEIAFDELKGYIKKLSPEKKVSQREIINKRLEELSSQALAFGVEGKVLSNKILAELISKPASSSSILTKFNIERKISQRSNLIIPKESTLKRKDNF